MLATPAVQDAGPHRLLYRKAPFSRVGRCLHTASSHHCCQRICQAGLAVVHHQPSVCCSLPPDHLPHQPLSETPVKSRLLPWPCSTLLLQPTCGLSLGAAPCRDAAAGHQTKRCKCCCISTQHSCKLASLVCVMFCRGSTWLGHGCCRFAENTSPCCDFEQGGCRFQPVRIQCLGQHHLSRASALPFPKTRHLNT